MAALKQKPLPHCPSRSPRRKRRRLARSKRIWLQPSRMLRLLQGDVGAGKTIVAFLALLDAIEAGTQGALMAPTELLARQHMQALAPLATATGVRMSLLTGRERGAPASKSWRRLPKARSIFSSARMRCSRRTSCFAIWASPSSTSSTASACISGCNCRAKVRRTCW